MASVYKRKKTVTNPKTGKQKTSLSKKWHARYRDENGRLRRISLSPDKRAAQKMLSDILANVELRRSGLDDPFNEANQKPIWRHLSDFEYHLKSKNSTASYIRLTITRVRRCCEACSWIEIQDIEAFAVELFLVDLREKNGLSIETSNHYLRAIKSFAKWLVRNRRLQSNPLESLATLNAATDRRHDRRSLSPEEFDMIYRIAKEGPPSSGLTGPDRAMLYMLAAWTGLRRGEIASLTRKSFRLTAKPPTVRVEAAYSKHRRADVLILHHDLVESLQDWLSACEPEENETLFPLTKLSGTDRYTSKMLKFDLQSARTFWLAEAEDEREREQREKSDFLLYKDSRGRFADFHALRHTFITNLVKANVSPKVAQSLARHSDIRLTMDLYSHIAQEEQAEAIKTLPGPKPA